MNGAIADPLVKTIRPPKISNINIIGNNQNFFLSFRNPHKSLKKSIVTSPINTVSLYPSVDTFYVDP
jgi:hypothetical protein